MKRLSWVAVLCALQSTALMADELNDRVSRLERLLESQSLVEMLSQMERLQTEVQELRGEAELRSHQIDELKQRQRDLYLDVDRRLSRVEREGGGAGVVSSSAGSEPSAAPALSMTKPSASQTVSGSGGTPMAAGAPQYSAEEERAAYQKAFDLLRELRYEQAIKAFGAFLKDYPNGRYGHIAQYWVGEANYAQRNFKQAISDYQQLIKVYTQSPKLAEAMLKIGYSYYELGDKNAASSTLNELVKTYPDTTEAGQATAFLKRLKRDAN